MGQWWWLSWHSNRFWHQRSIVRNPDIGKVLLNIVYCQLSWIDENKEKRPRMDLLKKCPFREMKQSYKIISDKSSFLSRAWRSWWWKCSVWNDNFLGTPKMSKMPKMTHRRCSESTPTCWYQSSKMKFPSWVLNAVLNRQNLYGQSFKGSSVLKRLNSEALPDQ